MNSDDNIPKPKIGAAASSGNNNPQASAYVAQIAMPGDRILRSRGGGDLSLYEHVLSDPQVASCFLQRRNAVQAKEWRVEAGGDRRVDIKAADHLRLQLQRVGFDNVTDKMLYGVFYGYSAAEVLWDVDDGKYGWKAIKVRNRRKFKFAADGTLRRFSSANVIDGLPALPPYFWHFATGADNDDEPYGLGLAHWCYWPVLFKRQGIKFWLIFLDKFGMPTSHGKFPTGTNDTDKARLLQACQAIATDTSIITPDGMVIDLIEAARSGTADYKTLHDTMNDTIAKAIIGQTASSQGTPGKLGNDALQGDVRLDIIKADADLVCESLNLGPIRWMTQFNFPDAEPPRVFRVIEEPEDATEVADRDTKVKAMGFKPSLKYVKDQYGDHWEEAAPLGSDEKLGPDGKPLPADPEFAERQAIERTRDATSLMVTQLDGDVLSPQEWVERIRELVTGATSLTEIRDQLLALYPTMGLDDYADAMAVALGAAHLAGRNDVQDEARGSDG